MAVERPYEAQNWATGDVITKNKMQHIEDGIAAIDTEFKELKDAFSFISPFSYDAKGDGITDDTEAFNAALASGLLLYIGGGNYYINGTVTLSENQKIIGDGQYLYSEKSRIILGPNGSIVVSSADCAIKGIKFVGEDATNNPETYHDGAIIASRVNYKDIDLTIEDCSFSGFKNAITVNGRGLYLRKCMFSNYDNAVVLNYVDTSQEMHRKYGGRAFIIKDNRFHTNSASTRDCNSILVSSGSTVYGMTIEGNYFDQNAGRVNFQGNATDVVVLGNQWIFPCVVNGSAIMSANSTILSDVLINDNTFTSHFRYAQDGNATLIYVYFGGLTYGVTISGNVFSYAENEAIFFAQASGTIITRNMFSSLSMDDTVSGKAISFGGIAVDTVIADNVYYDTEYYGKTQNRYFLTFGKSDSVKNLRSSNNVAVKGNTIDTSAVVLASATMVIDGSRITIKQTSHFGNAKFTISGLDSSSAYTISLNVLDKSDSYDIRYSVNNGTSLSMSARGVYTIHATSSEQGEIVLQLNPSSASGVYVAAVFDQIRIKKGALPDDGVISLTNINIYDNNVDSDADKRLLESIALRTVGNVIYTSRDDVEIGKSIKTNGGIATGVGAAFITGYIPIAPGYKYSINQGLSSSAYCNAFYNEEFEMVGYQLSSAAPVIATAPATAKYLRATGLSARVDEFAITVYGLPT